MDTYASGISALHSALSEIDGNVGFIEKELPGLKLPDAERTYIGDTCRAFKSCIYDVRSEIWNLADKLGMNPGQAPNDPDIQNPDPRVTMGFIYDWLMVEIQGLHQTVSLLEKGAKQNTDLGSAYLLVAESAVNILQAFEKIKNALATIEGQLGSKNV
jgi:hypothetical protein